MQQTSKLDFCSKNLRSRSFKGQDLTGANFSYADLRGADFTNAILRGADFSHAQAGTQQYWTFSLLLVLFFLVALLGFIAGIAGAFMGDKQLDNSSYIFISAIALVISAIFLLVTIGGSLQEGLQALIWIGILALAIALVSASPTAAILLMYLIGILAYILVLALILGFLFVFICTVIAVFSKDYEGFISCFATLTFALILVLILGGAWDLISPRISSLYLFTKNLIKVLTATGIWALLTSYIGWQTFLTNNKNFAFMRRIAINVATVSGTKFRGADLTDANFTQASLGSTDFTRAVLNGTCWLQSRNLRWAKFSEVVPVDSES